MKKYALILIAFGAFGLFAANAYAQANQSQYEYKVWYDVPSATDPTGAKTPKLFTGGPFATQSACYQAASNSSGVPQGAPAGSTIDQNNGGFVCSCDSPISSQPSCPDYAAPAQTPSGSVGPGGACKQDSDCQDTSTASYGCYPEGNGICTVNGDAAADGTVQPGGACTNDTSCADVNGQSYGCYQGTGTCTLNGDAPAGATGAPSTSGTANGTGFVPLAPIPGLTDNQTTPNIAAFLSSLYNFAIGIAAALAIIYIIWGGAEIMTQDSISKQGAGREKIQNALLGLVLVLAPYLVFYIINPSILNLNINMPALTTASGGGGSGSGLGGTANTNPTPAAPTSGCSTNTANQYLTTATCATNAAAQSFSCPSGSASNNVIPPCTTLNASNQCVQTTTSVYCEGTITLQNYVVIQNTGCIVGSFCVGPSYPSGAGTIVPDDAQQLSAFQSQCQANGGTASANFSWTNLAHGAVGAATGGFSCPADVTHPSGTDVECASVQYTCQPGS